MHDPAVTPQDCNAAGILRRLDDLANCTDVPGEITRLFLSPAHRQATDLVITWMTHAGLHATLDPSGTVVGRLPAAAPDAPVVMLGSHIDTVRNAGRYDGCLGVVMAIALAAHFGPAKLPFTLEIRAFGDEEGVRFPVTMTSAHAAAGSFDSAWLATTDADGKTLRQALQDFGLDPEKLRQGACAAHAAAYLEIHIEQGPVLEAHGAPLGIVTAINGAARLAVSVQGSAGHAGTVPMNARADALTAAAAMVLAAEAIARAHPPAVATVGQLKITPNATNVIPGNCHFTLDVRAPTDAQRDAVAHDIATTLATIAGQRGVTLDWRQTHQAGAVACDTILRACLAEAIAKLDLPVIALPSGAGHDAMVMAAHCPVAMLFLRCRGGISHHPAEHVTEADVAAALAVMTQLLASFGEKGNWLPK